MEVVWTENAIAQFRTAYGYLLEVAGENVAQRMAHRIERAAAKLSTHPKSNRVR